MSGLAVGDLVRFAHEADTGPDHTITKIEELGGNMGTYVEIDTFPGQFGINVFVESPTEPEVSP